MCLTGKTKQKIKRRDTMEINKELLKEAETSPIKLMELLNEVIYYFDSNPEFLDLVKNFDYFNSLFLKLNNIAIENTSDNLKEEIGGHIETFNDYWLSHLTEEKQLRGYLLKTDIKANLKIKTDAYVSLK